MSKIEIGLRVPKSIEYPYGYKVVSSIPYDRPCVVCFGGDGTTNGQFSNGNAKVVDEMLQQWVPEENVPVYSVMYIFEDNDPRMERRLNTIRQRGEPLSTTKEDLEYINHATEDENDPNYIDCIYRAVLLPRLENQEGVPYDFKTACKYLRFVTLVNNCHGAFVFSQAERKMQEKMKQQGRSAEEMKQMQSQVIGVSTSPACVVKHLKSTFYSFQTAKDIIWPKSRISRYPNNMMSNYLFDNIRKFKSDVVAGKYSADTINQIFPLCYLEKDRMFLCGAKYPYLRDIYMENPDEHGDISFYNQYQTKDAKIWNVIRATLITNAVRHSFQQQQEWIPLPNLENLLRLEGENPQQVQDKFAVLKKRGQNFYKNLFAYSLMKRQAFNSMSR